MAIINLVLFQTSCRSYFEMGGGRDYVCSLLANVHDGLEKPQEVSEIYLVKGDYLYYHYGCDGFDDRVSS